jgi:hypothetical protein
VVVTTFLVWLAVAIVLAFAISGLTMLFISRLAQRRVPEAVDRATAGGQDAVLIAPMVQFYGVASAGRGQLRGAGSLILTETTLRFSQWQPQRELAIALSDLVRVDTTHRHLGKFSRRPLLRVSWRTWDGLEDVAAWSVRRLDEWLPALQQAHDDPGHEAGPE